MFRFFFELSGCFCDSICNRVLKYVFCADFVFFRIMMISLINYFGFKKIQGDKRRYLLIIHLYPV